MNESIITPKGIELIEDTIQDAVLLMNDDELTLAEALEASLNELVKKLGGNVHRTAIMLHAYIIAISTQEAPKNE